MSFSYTDPRNSALEALRFTIGDTVESEAMLQDEEILYILEITNSYNKQLELAYRQCASHFAKMPTDRRLGPQSEKTKDRLDYFTKLAEKYEKLAAYSSAPPAPTYSSDPIFDKGMMPNV